MPEVDIKVYSGAELDEVLPAWTRLAEAQPGASLFASPLWIVNYWQFRARVGAPPKLVAGYTLDGRLIGLAPFNRIIESGQTLFPLIRAPHSTGEYVSDWCCDPDWAPAFVAAVYDHFYQERPAWFQLALNDAPEGSPVLAGLRQLCLERRLPHEELPGPTVPIVPVDGPASDALALVPGKYRREILRKTRELEKLGEVTFDEIRLLDQLEVHFDDFVQVEGSGWKSRNGGAIACQPDAREFWWHLAREAALAGLLRLHLLRCGNHTIAGQLGIRWGARYYCLKVGYDESYRRFGPGAIVTQHALQACLDDPEIRVYDFAGAVQPYMLNWTSDVYETRRLSIAPPRRFPRMVFMMRLLAKRAARKVKHSLARPDAIDSASSKS